MENQLIVTPAVVNFKAPFQNSKATLKLSNVGESPILVKVKTNQPVLQSSHTYLRIEPGSSVNLGVKCSLDGNPDPAKRYAFGFSFGEAPGFGNNPEQDWLNVQEPRSIRIECQFIDGPYMFLQGSGIGNN